jgi:DNA invertase Pin-like site-specific DNA recombinase
MLVGYARVSTHDQNIDLQKDELAKAGCQRIFYDIVSGVRSERTGLNEAINYIREGDILVVWKLDRLGRSLKHLINIVSELKKQKIGFKSLRENIDTTSSGGRLIFHVFGALAEFERELIKERTCAGLLAARSRGKKGGRPKIMDAKKIAMAKTLYNDKQNSIGDICKTLKISKPTLYRYLNNG